MLPSFQLSPNAQLSQHVRALCRSKKIHFPTAHLAPSFLQANLVVLEKQHAFDFLRFCLRNAQACPLLDVVSNNEICRLAPSVNLATDLPKYRVYRKGKLISEPLEVSQLWPKDSVSFLLGCSFSFDFKLKPYMSSASALCSTVPMYLTNVNTVPSGVFQNSKLVVSMRYIKKSCVEQARVLTELTPLSHGGPIKVGFDGARELGIDLHKKPDFGEAVLGEEDCVPLFWACGVTSQQAIISAELDTTVITHAPGCMLVTDVEL